MTLHTDAELDRIIVDLGRAGSRVVKAVTAVVTVGANNVKRDARKFASGLAHAPHYPRSITYDLDFSGGAIGADIGPDKNLPQGALGNLLEYGSINNAPATHLGPALDRETPGFVDHVNRAGHQAML
jgi:hypothetical protein